MIRERELIHWLRQQQRPHPLVPLSIGDDAAWINFSNTDGFVTTVDMLMDGVDFLYDKVAPHQIGHKALAINLSDLAAMAATPIATLVSIALPRTLTMESLKLIYGGMFALADKFDVHIAGGDTSLWDGPLTISITAFGRPEAPGVISRAGARIGDAILVTGDLGGSIFGKHLDFLPRVSEALYLHKNYPLHAMTDISDGLATDLRNICFASGVAAHLQQNAIPINPAARQHRDDRTTLEHAMTDGEDFELCFTLAQSDADRLLPHAKDLSLPITQVGTIRAGDGLWWHNDKTQALEAVTWEGYEHR